MTTGFQNQISLALCDPCLWQSLAHKLILFPIDRVFDPVPSPSPVPVPVPVPDPDPFLGKTLHPHPFIFPTVSNLLNPHPHPFISPKVVSAK